MALLVYNNFAIKNLSISLEALSRINGATNLSYEIEQLLQQEIEKAKEENEPKPESRFEQETKPDDDIPF